MQGDRHDKTVMPLHTRAQSRVHTHAHTQSGRQGVLRFRGQALRPLAAAAASDHTSFAREILQTRDAVRARDREREREMHAEGVRVLFHVVALVRLRLSVCGRASLGGKGARDAGSETMCPPSFPSRRKHLISSQSEGMKPGKRGREGRVAEESERGLDRLRMRV